MSVILAIESSCDDTSASIVKDGKVLSNVTDVQAVHKELGGVVPELASRQHLIHIAPVVEMAIKSAGIRTEDIDAVGFTRGPGLLGSLLVGVSFAKAFALGLDKPLIEVHHMHAHILAHFAEDPKPEFPFLCLTVSGGHTQIVLVKHYNVMEILGSTIDDAAGEAFDKVGKMLGLPYPAGPIIDKNAKLGIAQFEFAKPIVSDLNYSFSGFKTSVLYFLRDKMKENEGWIEENLLDICASAQKAIVDILMVKLVKAANWTKINRIAIAGGVAANSGLREKLNELADKHKWQVFIPKFEYCTDNAAMIGIAAYYKYLDQIFSNQEVSPDPKLHF